jgi:outer membrane receptor protein involved in Fe transport
MGRAAGHRSRRRARVRFGRAALIPTLALAASAIFAGNPDQVLEFEIPKQPLETALKSLARQADLQILLSPGDVASLESPPLAGSMSARDALQRLLAGTPLSFVIEGRDTIVVLAEAPRASTHSDSTPASPPPAETATAQAWSPPRIEQIIVTARKRAERAQDIPVSLTALSQGALERYDLTDLERVAESQPQFAIGRAPSGSGATLVLRGIGSNTTSIGLEQSVAVVVDGAYYGQGRVINDAFFDLERVEILKGPQALFFGKNATAGAVSITTRNPGWEPEFMARIGGELESDSLIGELVGSIPVSETFGLRVALRATGMSGGLFENRASTQTYRTRDIATGTITDHAAPRGQRDLPGTEDYVGRITARWTPTSHLTATLKGSAGRSESANPASNSVLYACPAADGTYVHNPDVPCGRDFAIYQNAFPQALAQSIPYARDGVGNDYRSSNITGTLEYELDSVTVTSVSNYNSNRNVFRFDGDLASSSLADVTVMAATEWSEFAAFSTELRVLTHFDAPLNAMVGVYYQDTKRDYLAWTAVGGLENSAAPEPFQRYLANSKDSETDGATSSAFGQLIWRVAEPVELTAGVRYSYETKDSYFVQPYSHPTRVAQGVYLPDVRITADQSWNDWSPEATLSFWPAENVMLYGAWKTAYKSGAFSNSGILSPSAGIEDFTADPEQAEGFEIGLRSTLFERQLRLNAGAYSYRFTNLQLDFFRSDIFAFSLINVGSATTRGFELEFEYFPRAIEGLDLRGGLYFNDASYGNVPSAPCYQGQTPALGCTIVPGFGPRQNLAGKPTAIAPRWTASVGGSYEIRLGDDWLVNLSADTRYSDDYLASAFGNPLTRQSAYLNLDAAIRFMTSDRTWELALIGRNLTDEFHATGGIDAPTTGSDAGLPTGVFADQLGYVADPRTVQLRLTWRH